MGRYDIPYLHLSIRFYKPELTASFFLKTSLHHIRYREIQLAALFSITDPGGEIMSDLLRQLNELKVLRNQRDTLFYPAQTITHPNT